MNQRFFNIPVAFLKRDFLIASSYRLHFVLQMAGIVISTLMFFCLSNLIGQGMAGELAPYGGNYFAFVLIGVAFTDFLEIALESFAEEIRSAQVLGTLEALLVTPASLATILFSSCLYTYMFTSLRVIFYLMVGAHFFGLVLQITSFGAFLVIFLLTILAFSGIGLISAAFIIVFKQGSPVSWLMTVSSGLLGGVLYPVSVLPDWLEPLAKFLPITHALEAMRQILLNGATLATVAHQAILLALFVGILLPSGVILFGHGLRLAMREGSLVHY